MSKSFSCLKYIELYVLLLGIVFVSCTKAGPVEKKLDEYIPDHHGSSLAIYKNESAYEIIIHDTPNTNKHLWEADPDLFTHLCLTGRYRDISLKHNQLDFNLKQPYVPRISLGNYLDIRAKCLIHNGLLLSSDHAYTNAYIYLSNSSTTNLVYSAEFHDIDSASSNISVDLASNTFNITIGAIETNLNLDWRNILGSLSFGIILGSGTNVFSFTRNNIKYKEHELIGYETDVHFSLYRLENDQKLLEQFAKHSNRIMKMINGFRSFEEWRRKEDLSIISDYIDPDQEPNMIIDGEVQTFTDFFASNYYGLIFNRVIVPTPDSLEFESWGGESRIGDFSITCFRMKFRHVGEKCYIVHINGKRHSFE